MQGSIRQLITNLHSTNIKLEELVKKEKQQKAFLATSLSDARLALREHKKEISRLRERMKNATTN